MVGKQESETNGRKFVAEDNGCVIINIYISQRTWIISLKIVRSNFGYSFDLDNHL